MKANSAWNSDLWKWRTLEFCFSGAGFRVSGSKGCVSRESDCAWRAKTALLDKIWFCCGIDCQGESVPLFLVPAWRVLARCPGFFFIGHMHYGMRKLWAGNDVFSSPLCFPPAWQALLACSEAGICSDPSKKNFRAPLRGGCDKHWGHLSQNHGQCTRLLGKVIVQVLQGKGFCVI